MLPTLFAEMVFYCELYAYRPTYTRHATRHDTMNLDLRKIPEISEVQILDFFSRFLFVVQCVSQIIFDFIF